MKSNLLFSVGKIYKFCFYFSVFVLSVNFLRAQTCTNVTTNPNAYGNGSWIGHVYDHTGAGNPVTSPFVTYKGYTTETEIFDRNWGTSNPVCAAGSENFAVRYRMNKTFASGNYTFTIGADDGVRLSIDGGATWIVSDWSDHGYQTISIRVPMSGNYNLVLEYYEKTGGAQVSFGYTSDATSTNFSMPNSNGTTMITTCSGTLYDSGGSAAGYGSGEDRSVIIRPATAGNRVQISGSITTEGGFDYLTIYDGAGTAGTVLWGGAAHGSGTACTTFTVPVRTSSTGPLTVRFFSNGSNNCVGFNLAVSCVAPVSPCITPSNPSSFIISAISSTTLTLGFTPPVTAPSGGYVVFRSTSATPPVLTNGTTYADGNSYSLPSAAYTVISNGSATSIPQSGLTSNTRYYYYVFSQNTACSGAPFYSTGITGNQITCPVAATGNSVSVITTNSATISWSAAAAGGGAAPINYFIDVSTNAGFTSPIAGSPFNNGTSVSRIITGLTIGTPYFYRIRANNGCEGSVSGNFSTICKPSSSNPGINYINDVEFRGTLNDVLNNNSGVSDGYQNFTGMASKTMQAAGEGINVFVKSSGRDVSWKAWVDWSRDGVFNNTAGNSEIVFISNGVQAISTSFGFVIPAGTAPGDYVIRIRNYRSCTTASGFCGDTNYDPCAAFTGSNNGEAEDYIITVTANCAAVINSVWMGNPLTDYCGASNIPLIAKVSTGTTKVRWYNAETGGSLLAETSTALVGGVLQSTFTTPLISSSTTYWVTSFNGTCETIYRKPVTAKIKPVPVLSFNLPLENANFCGEDDRLILTTSGNQEQVILIDEDFEDKTTLGDFTVTNGAINNSNAVQTQWQNQGSPFKPVGAIWSPVISSGYSPNKFAFATSDYSTRKVETILTSTNTYSTSTFTTLDLSFIAYYSFYGDTSSSTGGVVEGFFVEVSTNNGANWTTVKTYDAANPGPDGTPSLGYGTRFRNLSVNLDAYRNVPSLKIRFRYRAYWGDGVAIDNIKLYGNRPLSTSFNWTAPNIGVFQADCTTPYINGTTTTSICIKPTDAQLQAISDWNITATQTVSNGCTPSASIAIHNDNKVWDNNAITNWANTNWQPTAAVPDISKCVLIKQPVNILTGGNFEAKNVKVLSGGTLTINKDSSLKIQDYLNNQSTAQAVRLESDGNLIQVNNGADINTGSITAKKTMKISNPRQQYNYLMSPLEGQSLKTIYPGIDFVLYHNETNNYFYSSSGAYIKGRGLAVKEPNAGGTGVPAGNSTVTGTFTGKPTNGIFTYNLINTAPSAVGTGNSVRGYNLIGNPYPSNIDMTQFYAINGGNSGTLSSTFYFWDSSVNDIYVQQGSNYGGQSYGQFNADSGIGTPATGDIGSNSLIVPTRYVKVGKGFMSRSVTANTSLLFNNSIRTNALPPLNSKGVEINQDAGDHYWLSLVSPADIASTIAVAYFPGGDNNLARDDSFSLMGSDALYSIVENEKISINGRSPFDVQDEVALGTAHFTSGNYRIMLKDADGVFANGQKIYLKDRETGILTNLSEGDYSFAATAGQSTGRFEIVYQPEAVLATEGTAKENVIVYRDGSNFVVKAKSKKITALEMYDGVGRLIYSAKPNAVKVTVPTDLMLNGVYILKIDQGGKVTTKKVIR